MHTCVRMLSQANMLWLGSKGVVARAKWSEHQPDPVDPMPALFGTTRPFYVSLDLAFVTPCSLPCSPVVIMIPKSFIKNIAICFGQTVVN